MTGPQEKLITELRDLRRLVLSHGAIPHQIVMPPKFFRMFKRIVRQVTVYTRDGERNFEFMGIEVVENPRTSTIIMWQNRDGMAAPRTSVNKNRKNFAG